ncbi:hypothetical protein BOTBODRAFT_142807 [Botryobasidium botryosum FD-172 SS1]|uniref:F-box domain-containing protein n=1 Tax=Botryobasidium botryosum (strain FD-172 SS1) TaxID=930990 RepID=A0A067N844_BOTB1|nr:hypothetical protein BOTBODRAFT_142807 [Botryobasidium botryosum FD-172 SS1]
MSRWRSLHIVNDEKGEPYKTLSYCVYALPSLEALSLCSYTDYDRTSAPKCLYFVPTPNLKALTIEGTCTIPSFLLIPQNPGFPPFLPWLQGLTSLTLRCTSFTIGVNFCSYHLPLVLREATNLESLTLDVSNLVISDSNPKLGRIEVPALRRLSISSGFAREHLHRLTAPALECLQLNVIDGSTQYNQSGAHIVEFIERSTPPLRELYINDDVLEPVFFHKSVLSTLPELEALTLIGMDLSEDDMRLLWAPMAGSGAWACPRLRSFSASNAPAAYFLRLLKARNPPLDSLAKPDNFTANACARVTYIGCWLGARDMKTIAEALGSYPGRIDEAVMEVVLSKIRFM